MEIDQNRESLTRELSEAGLSGKYGEPGDLLYVRVWIRDKFRCVYCGEDLLKDRIRMTSDQLDHLLPKSKYKEYAALPANLVLSCFTCNQIKRNFDPLAKLPEVRAKISPKTFEAYQSTLIEECQHFLKSLLKVKDDILAGSIAIVMRNR